MLWGRGIRAKRLGEHKAQDTRSRGGALTHRGAQMAWKHQEEGGRVILSWLSSQRLLRCTVSRKADQWDRSQERTH